MHSSEHMGRVTNMRQLIHVCMFKEFVLKSCCLRQHTVYVQIETFIVYAPSLHKYTQMHKVGLQII